MQKMRSNYHYRGRMITLIPRGRLHVGLSVCDHKIR